MDVRTITTELRPLGDIDAECDLAACKRGARVMVIIRTDKATRTRFACGDHTGELELECLKDVLEGLESFLDDGTTDPHDYAATVDTDADRMRVLVASIAERVSSDDRETIGELCGAINRHDEELADLRREQEKTRDAILALARRLDSLGCS